MHYQAFKKLNQFMRQRNQMMKKIREIKKNKTLRLNILEPIARLSTSRASSTVEQAQDFG